MKKYIFLSLLSLCALISVNTPITKVSAYVGVGSSPVFVSAQSAVGADFQPSDLINLVEWLDDSDTGEISDTGGLVDQQNDKSGAGANATSTGTARPETNSVTVNGLNAIDHDGTEHMTLSTDTLGGTKLFCDSGDSFTIALMLNVTGSNGTVISRRGTKNILQVGISSNQLFIDARDTTTFSLGTLNGGTKILMIRWNGTILEYTLGGTSWTTLTVGAETDDTTEILLAARTPSSPAFRFTGQRPEVIITDGAETDIIVNQIGNYYSDKWGAAWGNL